MGELPYALGCPSCPYWVQVSKEDADASLSDLANHIFWKHAPHNHEESDRLLALAVELTKSKAASR